MELTKETVIGKMRECGLKLTPQRQAIIEVFLEKKYLHPAASLIYQEAKKKVRGLSLSTVYSTLTEFSKQGIIKLLEFDRMENRYEGNLAAHINLICKGCGKIADYPSLIAIDPQKVARRAHFQVIDSRLEYYGYCPSCRKK